MNNHTLYIKNMVCPRCVESVRSLLQSEKFNIVSVELGKAVVNNKLSQETLLRLGKQLKERGFELLQDKNQKIIDKIKTEIINIIHYDEGIEGHINISDHISKTLGYDYSYLSNLFTTVEGTTIEKYLIRQKIERVKELLIYDELTLKEISWTLGYSSVQHLSGQFKKITGQTPTQFKNLRSLNRKSLDKI